MIGRVSAARADWDQRVALAERLGARVLTDIKTGASFPTVHKLHPFPPSLYVTDEAGALIREADVDPQPRLDRSRRHHAASLRGAVAAGEGVPVLARPVQPQWLEHGLPGPARRPTSPCSPRPTGWWSACWRRSGPARRDRAPKSAAHRRKPGPDIVDGRLSVEAMARTVTDALAAHNPSYHPPAARLAGLVLPLRGSARLHRLRRRRRHRLRARHGRRRRAWPCAAPTACPSRCSATATT